MTKKSKQLKRKDNPYQGLFVFTDPVKNRKYMEKHESDVARSILKLEEQENVDTYRLKEQRLKLEAIQSALNKEQ